MSNQNRMPSQNQLFNQNPGHTPKLATRFDAEATTFDARAGLSTAVCQQIAQAIFATVTSADAPDHTPGDASTAAAT